MALTIYTTLEILLTVILIISGILLLFIFVTSLTHLISAKWNIISSKSYETMKDVLIKNEPFVNRYKEIALRIGDKSLIRFSLYHRNINNIFYFSIFNEIIRSTSKNKYYLTPKWSKYSKMFNKIYQLDKKMKELKSPEEYIKL